MGSDAVLFEQHAVRGSKAVAAHWLPNADVTTKSAMCSPAGSVHPHQLSDGHDAERLLRRSLAYYYGLGPHSRRLYASRAKLFHDPFAVSPFPFRKVR